MQINYEQAKVLTSPSSLVLHYPVQIPSHSFYPSLHSVSQLTPTPSCHPHFLVALHWLSLSGFFCPPSTDPEHKHMSLAINPHLVFTFCCISTSSVSVCALPSTHLQTSIPSCPPFTHTAVFSLT
jgi:hypothetical protein